MGEQTTISWCDHTFNGWEGCTKISPGCKNCYAETRNHRFGNDNWGKGKPRRRTSAANWKQPLKWNKHSWICSECGYAMTEGESKGYRACPTGKHFVQHHRARVFCASLADWLDDEVPIEWLTDLLKLIHDTPNLDWLLLTKRPENFFARTRAAIGHAHGDDGGDAIYCPDNIWLGVSVEDQQRADERIPLLLQIPAKVRFLSVEPMLGPIDLDGTKGSHDGMGLCWDWAGKPTHVPHCDYRAIGKEPPNGPAIHWCIFGGESGPGARPCNIEWIRDGVRQCRAAGVAPFVKQLGSQPMSNRGPQLIKLRDKKGGDMSEWPKDLQDVREFPEIP